MDIKKIFDYKKIKNCQLVEFFLNKEKNISFDIKRNKIKNFTEFSSQGLGIRIIKNYKQNLIYTTNIEEKNIFKLIDKCLETIHYIDEQRELEFLQKEKFNGIISEDKIFKINKKTLEEKKDFLIKTEQSIKNNKKININIDSISYDEKIYETKIINSKGLNKSEKGAYCGSSCFLSLKKNDFIETGYSSFYDRDIDKLFNKNLLKKAYKKAFDMIGSQIIKTGKYKVLLTSEIAASFLYLLSYSFNGENIYKKKSLFVNRINDEVVNSNITIIDDPTLKSKLGFTFFDCEGVKTKKNIIIKNGILKKYLFNLTFAKLNKTSTTGNCIRNYTSLPGINFHNLYIKKGDIPEKKLNTYLNNGLIINDLMGLHMADNITGNFSFGASGFVVKNGKIKNSFRGITISGNILDLFNKIIYLGKKVKFKGTLGSPAIIISELVISGS